MTDTNVVVDPATGEMKLRMKFQNAPLKTVLDYMSAAAGYIIHPRVPISGKVSVWSDQPMNKDEALALVKQMLNENGYAAIMEGRTLTIYSSGTVKSLDIPVILGNIPTNIPKNTEIVTQIIPVRSLNAVALLKDLQPLLPAQTTLTANESGNALIMTDTQANIHRIVEIVRALDSVSSSSSTIIVFPLKYADAKSVASLIKDLFPSASATTGGGWRPRRRVFGTVLAVLAVVGLAAVVTTAAAALIPARVTRRAPGSRRFPMTTPTPWWSARRTIWFRPSRNWSIPWIPTSRTRLNSGCLI